MGIFENAIHELFHAVDEELHALHHVMRDGVWLDSPVACRALDTREAELCHAYIRIERSMRRQLRID